MMVVFLCHGLIQKTGAFPLEGDIKRAFDTAELIAKESMRREERLRQLEREFDEAQAKARAAQPPPPRPEPTSAPSSGTVR